MCIEQIKLPLFSYFQFYWSPLIFFSATACLPCHNNGIIQSCISAFPSFKKKRSGPCSLQKTKTKNKCGHIKFYSLVAIEHSAVVPIFQISVIVCKIQRPNSSCSSIVVTSGMNLAYRSKQKVWLLHWSVI